MFEARGVISGCSELKATQDTNIHGSFYMQPTFSFTIPSLYDGIRLECRLHHPAPERGAQSRFTNAIIIAHPYAPLGGCFDDPVVGVVGEELLKMGWIVGTFNLRYEDNLVWILEALSTYCTCDFGAFHSCAYMDDYVTNGALRGAGKSGGRTSWTGKPEIADYISFYGFMMYYLHEFEKDGGLLLSKDEGDAKFDASTVCKANLILSGYSYGSMLASYLPSSATVLELFSSPQGGRLAEGIKLTAHQLFTTWARDRYTGPSEIPVASPSVSYLLISPILPPVTFFTAMSLFKPHGTLDVVIKETRIKSRRPEENLTTHQSLAIYGDDDVFTSVRKLQKWCTELKEIPDSQFQHQEVHDAGHFWLNDAAVSRLKTLIREWISTTF